MTTSALGSVLSMPPAEFPESRARAELAAHWGLSGSLRRLTSERDVNYHLETEAGHYVLKLAHPAEPTEETEFQIAALEHLRAADLPVPRMIPARDGRLLLTLPEGRLRLLTYLQGTPLHLSPRTDAQRNSVGRTAARLALALADFRHTAARRYLIWDIQNTARLRPMAETIPDQAARQMVLAGIDQFCRDLLPRIPGLPTQVVHNDLNPFNILVLNDDTDEVSGVLDFGDMVETARLLDLGIACSYQIEAARPVDSLMAVAAAYHQIAPLTGAEIRLLPHAVLARLCTTLTITAERARMYPENAAYISRNVPISTANLAALNAIGTERIADALEKALT